MAASFERDSDFTLNFRNAIPTRLGDKIKWVVLAAGLVLLFVLLTLAKSFYTDWLWFTELGYRSVYLKTLLTRVVLFIVGAAMLSPMTFSM